MKSFTNPLHPCGWTLSFEMWFYVLFGGIMAGFGATRARLLMPLILIVGVLFVFLFYRGSWFMPRFAFHPMVMEFCAGSLLFHFRHKLSNTAIASVLLLALPMFCYFAVIQQHLAWHPQMLADPILGFTRAIVWGGLASCLIGLVIHMDQKGAVQYPKLLLYLGDASYSIYLIQPFGFRLASEVSPAGSSLGGLVFLAWSIVGGLGLHLFVDKPLRRLARPFCEALFRAKLDQGLELAPDRRQH